jgi:tetratricopeptide (TPR) repeat protein
VVTTWREHPPPEGALAEVAEALARKHALRLQLRGISTDATAQVFAQISESEPTAAETAALRRRTEGNPFFLVEYARLARDRGDLGALLSEPQPPAAVHEVLSRRLASLDGPTRDLLQSASVIGRIFELGTLAATAGTAEDAALDALEPALAAGLVDEDGVDRFRFTHALVRDTVLSGLPASRRARVHARAAAALEGRPGHETEVARHWLAAGPRHLGDAWPAAQLAARKATEVFAYVEALEMLEHALRAQDLDPGSDDYARFELLTDLADVLRRAGRWIELRGVTHEAVEVAEELGDLELLTVAGVMTSTGALWQAAAHAEVDPYLVDALRRALDRLPTGDDPRRCRVMLALAGEIYYGSTPQEREALCEEAVAMAHRIGDRELTLNACLNAAIAVWRGGTAQWRLDLSTEAVEIAREIDDDVSLTAALTLQAVAAGELGELALMDEAMTAARAAADRQRHVYAQLVLDSLETSWAAMRGRFDEVEKIIEHMRAIGEVVSITGYAESVAGALLMLLLWQGRDDELVAIALSLEGNTFLPVATSILAIQCRTGHVDDARAWYDTHRDDVAAAMRSDTWYSPMAWSMGAEAACYLGEPELAATAYRLLVDLAGRPACAGSGTAIGPIDMFLAMAAHATGEDELATRHADRALELCAAWDVPLAADWVRRTREAFGF